MRRKAWASSRTKFYVVGLRRGMLFPSSTPDVAWKIAEKVVGPQGNGMDPWYIEIQGRRNSCDGVVDTMARVEDKRYIAE
jgi:hypothetical protein